MTYKIGSTLARLLGILGLVPGVWVVGSYLLDVFGMRNSELVLEDAIFFGGISILSLILLIPWLERPLIRRSISYNLSIVKSLVVIPLTALVAIQGSAGLLSIDFVEENAKLLVTFGVLAIWLAFLFFAVYPGYYARLLDRQADPTKRGISMASRNIKTRLSFDAHPRGYYAPAEQKTSRLPGFVVKLLAILAILSAAVGFYGSRATNFIPDPDAVNWFEAHALNVAIAASLALLFVMLFSPDRSPKFFMRSKVLRAFVVAFMLGVAVFFGVNKSLATSIPALLASMETGAPGQIIVEVVQQNPDQFSGCTKSADVRMMDWAEGKSMMICSIPIGIWQELRPGLTLKLLGTRTQYGFTYTLVGRNWADS